MEGASRCPAFPKLSSSPKSALFLLPVEETARETPKTLALSDAIAFSLCLSNNLAAKSIATTGEAQKKTVFYKCVMLFGLEESWGVKMRALGTPLKEGWVHVDVRMSLRWACGSEHRPQMLMFLVFCIGFQV